jgi:hypothetical protein
VSGQYKENTSDAVRRYREKFPNRRVPNRPTFLSLDYRLRETGPFHGWRLDVSRPRSREQQHLVVLVRQPPMSIRLLASRTGACRASTDRPLRVHQLRRNHIQTVQV